MKSLKFINTMIVRIRQQHWNVSWWYQKQELCLRIRNEECLFKSLV